MAKDQYDAPTLALLKEKAGGRAPVSKSTNPPESVEVLRHRLALLAPKRSKRASSTKAKPTETVAGLIGKALGRKS